MWESIFYIFLGSFFGVCLVWAIYEFIYNRGFSAGYWNGRATGWQMHRRLIQIQNDVDEVFNYDDYK